MVGRDAKRPGDQFHRPFLFLLTQQEDEYEDLRLAPPINSNAQVTVRRQNTYSNSNSENSSNNWLLWLLVFIGIFSGVVTSHFNSSGNAKPKTTIERPDAKALLENADERTLEALRHLLDLPSDKDGEEKSDTKDPSAKFDMLDQDKTSSPAFEPNQRPSPVSKFPISKHPNSMLNRGHNNSLPNGGFGREQFEKRSPLNRSPRARP